MPDCRLLVSLKIHLKIWCTWRHGGEVVYRVYEVTDQGTDNEF